MAYHRPVSNLDRKYPSSDLGRSLPSSGLERVLPSRYVSRSYPSDDYGKRARYSEPVSTSAPADSVLSERVVYIGNLPRGVTEMEVLEFMNTLMHRAGLTTGSGDPILSHKMSPHGNFGLLEFHSAQEAVKCVGLDGVYFMGQNLRLKFLNDKSSTSGVSATASLNQPSRYLGQRDEPVVAASLTPPEGQRVVVQNVPSTASEMDVRELFKMLFTVAGIPEAQIYTVHMVNDVAILEVTADRVADFLDLDGASFKGNELKITRTIEDYQPPVPNLYNSLPVISPPLPGPASLNVPSMLPKEFSVSFKNPGRLLHVQNLPRGTRLDELMEVFNDEMHKRGLSNAPGTVVVRVASPVNTYAFVEFRSEEEATKGLELDNIIKYRGQFLKVVRYLKGYVPPSSKPQVPEPELCQHIEVSNIPEVSNTPGKDVMDFIREYMNDPRCIKGFRYFAETKSFQVKVASYVNMETLLKLDGANFHGFPIKIREFKKQRKLPRSRERVPN